VRIPWVDVKLAFRVLVKYPALTIVAMVSIAVAVAAVAGTFAVTDNLLDPRLPLSLGDRLVALQDWDVSSAAPEPRALSDFVTWREELRSIESLGAFTSSERDVTRAGGSSRPARVAEISATAFKLAETAPLLGRTLVAADEGPEGGQVAVLGYQIWQELFGADPGVVGRTLRVGDVPHEVVGVMPEGFRFPLNHSLWVPLRAGTPVAGVGAGPPIVIFGRLAEGVDIREAQAELSLLGQRTARQAHDASTSFRPRVVPYAQQWVGASRLGYSSVRIGLVLLLLVVGTNVAALVLARNLGREGEIAVRRALGAGRRQIVLQLTVEALVLVSFASVLGLVVATWGLDVMTKVLADSAFGFGGLPFWWHEGLTTGTVYRIAVLNGVCALLCGALPALMVTGSGAWGRLQSGASSGWSPRMGVGAKMVIAAQFALSVGFLTLAVAEWPDMIANEAPIRGLSPASYLTAVVRPLGQAEGEQTGSDVRMPLRRALVNRLGSESGVLGVTFATALPGMLHSQARTETDGASIASGDRTVRYASVDPAFFDVMAVELRAGREFTPQDAGAEADHPVVIVNESYARNRMGGTSVIGRQLRFVARRGEPGAWREVVGVVQDFGMNSIDPSRPEGLYLPLGDDHPMLAVAARATGDPATLAPRLRAVGATLEPQVVVERVRPLSAIIRSTRSQRRIEYGAVILGTLAVLMLTIGGLSAVMSFMVSRRTHEMGIRIALGARPSRVAFDIYSAAARRLGWGVALGIPVGVVLGSVVLEGGSAAVALKVSAALLAVGLLACAPATNRLLRVDPLEAIRGDV